MKTKASVARRSTARPGPKDPKWQSITDQAIVPKHQSLQLPKDPSIMIPDLLGDYSDQTGANFG